MYKIILSIFLLFSVSSAIVAQQVRIKGNAKSYAGDILHFMCYEDQISFKEKELAACKVDTAGNFDFKFDLKETTMGLIHLNVFRGILYIEPGKEYEIVLPMKVNKLPEDVLNPFFKEQDFYVQILNHDENELNSVIERFVKIYNAYVDKYFYLYKGRMNKMVIDSITNALDTKYSTCKNQFFNEFKEYNYYSLRMMAYERNKEKLIEMAFYNKPILYNNPAYMDLFNQLFSNYLAYYSKTRQGEKIPYYLVKERSLSKIKHALGDTAVLRDDKLQDLIIAKSLYENFYKEDFPRESILFMMDSIKKASSSFENRLIANNILEKITTLLVQYPAPDFELPDKNNKLIGLTSAKGKFVYLNFINPDSYTCLQELEMLKKMASKNYEMLEIITVCVCKDIEVMKKFIKEKSYNWKFLYYSDNEQLLKNYNVQVYPTYYLINPESKLAMSPAFPPTEATFEARYGDILKSWKKEVQNRKTKGLQH